MKDVLMGARSNLCLLLFLCAASTIRLLRHLKTMSNHMHSQTSPMRKESRDLNGAGNITFIL